MGGLYPKRESACRAGNSTSPGTPGGNGTVNPAPITPFTGQGSVVGVEEIGLLLSLVAGPVIGMLFWL